ncbi:hypothetical protein LGQ02_17875 [Bacillus shivajii]|uniref:PDZ domain-containing protein n=1 Tax=Bacillus shivajii TaxID=1983719 RepID=UPI001CFB1CB5|nr:PDZ domain-containing protein [Bacillus shivajii]UCZ52655.1 hypothetical protein LGQ02_17875 [Bacillus shivajii]
MEVIGLEVLKAIGQFFIHPLTYIFFLAVLWLGTRRVKREREDFHTRVYDFIHEVTFPLLVGLVSAVAVSIVVMTVGIVIPVGMLVLLMTLWGLLLPFRQVRWLSMTTIGSVAMLLIFVLPEGGTPYSLLNTWLIDIHNMNMVGFAWLLVILFTAEAILHLAQGWKSTTPALSKSTRGKTVGIHKVDRLWFLPIFLLVPAGAISYYEWWPLFSPSGTESAGLLLVPFVLTCQVAVQSQFPKDGIKIYGKRLLLLSMISIVVAVCAIFWPILAPVVAATILLLKEGLYVWYHSVDRRRNSMFSNHAEGLVVLGVLPYSTADKMNIEVGEVISKVNGYEVNSQRELYEALQMSPAYCKLEVIDQEGEIRFTQSSRYEGDHHQVGLLFIPDDPYGNLSPRALRSSVVIYKDREGTKVEGEGFDEVASSEEEQQPISEKETEAHDKLIENNGNIDVPQTEKDNEVASEEEVQVEPFEEVAATTEDNEEVLVDKEIESSQEEANSNEEKVKLFSNEEEAKQLNESLAEDVSKPTPTVQDEAPYGQASGLSAFYEEFRKSKPSKDQWKQDASDGASETEENDDKKS